MKRLLFSLTKKDFEVQTFRCGGKGGQNVNKVETGVRIIHPASGAVGRAVDTRHQAKNKELAFTRCVTSPAFKAWHKAECARLLGLAKTLDKELDQQMLIDKVIEDQMRPENLKIEEDA